MPTLKQVEALYWAGKLGSLVAAAERLNTTQSNVSKRIIELEQRLGVSFFDRSHRTIRLTAHGQNMMVQSERLLRQRSELLESLQGRRAYVGEYRFGVLESVGLTWLPRLVSALRHSYPQITPFPEVNTTSNLLERLRDRLIDLAIVTDSVDLMQHFETVLLAELRIGLFGKPELVAGMPPLSLADLPRLPIIAHSEKSGMQQLLSAFMRLHRTPIKPVIASNSLSVTSHLAASGAGFIFLPRQIAFPDLTSGKICEVPLLDELPTIRYVAAYRSDDLTSMSHDVGVLASEVCDFGNKAHGASGFDSATRDFSRGD